MVSIFKGQPGRLTSSDLLKKNKDGTSHMIAKDFFVPEMNTLPVTPGDPAYESQGFFVMDDIPTFRCGVCFQHQSLHDYAIDKNGLVTPDFVCSNCGVTHIRLKLNGIATGKRKNANDIYLA